MSEVWIKNGQGEKVIISDSTALEQHLLSRNRQQLRKAAPTPFADGPIGRLLQPDGSGEIADRIVNGEPILEIQHLDKVAKSYIKGMTSSNLSMLDSINMEMNMDDYRSFWKKKRESTVTSPFGLHIGHYKTSLDNESIAQIHLALLYIPFKYAYVPTRWSQTVQVMLEKDSGSPWATPGYP